MKLGRLNHIGVATPDLAASIAFYRDIMGARDITEPFDLPEQGVKVCFVNTPGDGGSLNGFGGTQIELLQPLSPDTAVGKWMERNPWAGNIIFAMKFPTLLRRRPGLNPRAKRCWANPASARTGQ